MFNGSFLRVCRILRLCPVFLTYLLPWGSESRAIVPVGIEGCQTYWKDEYGNHSLGTKAQNMHQLRVFGAK